MVRGKVAARYIGQLRGGDNRRAQRMTESGSQNGAPLRWDIFIAYVYAMKKDTPKPNR